MNPRQYFTLGRIIDKNYFTNKLIILITIFSLVAGSVINLVNGVNLTDATFSGLIFALIAFFTWALAREIYPQGEYAALIASLLSVVVIFFLEQYPMIIPVILWFIMALRFINQTTGLKPTIIDRSIIIIFTFFVSYLFSWIFFAMLILVFSINYFISKQKNDVVFTIISILSLLIFIIFRGIWYNHVFVSLNNFIIISMISLVFLITMFLVRNIRVICDNTDEKVSITRIYCAQILITFFCLIFVIWFGDEGFIMLTPVWCIFICSIILSPMHLIKKNHDL